MSNYNSIHTGAQIDNTIANIISNPPLSQSAASDLYLTKTAAENLYMTQDIIFFLSNITINTSGWASDSTYSSYPYRATISNDSITSNTYCEVIFGVNDAISGYFAPICESANGKIYIYARNIPLSSITIPTIKCINT